MKQKFFSIKAFIVFSLLAWQLSLAQQTPQPDTIIKKFDHYRKHALQEKIYVHLDQNFYLIGETAWFKIYCTDGSFHKPLKISKVAYVEILDKNNIPVLQTKVELKNGHGRGSVFLPATLQSGNYIFRCYTLWMKNFDADFYFQKPITIVNPFVKPETLKSKPTRAYRAEFFPEGGYLVADLRGKVAFKVSDSTGRGMDCSGAILDIQKDTIVTFKTGKFGLGNFVFTPLAGQKYHAVIKDINGSITKHAMPAVKEEGYVMTLTKKNDRQLAVSVASRFKDQAKAMFVYLFTHSRNIVSKAEVKMLREGKCIFLIDTENLPGGISHITILDENQRPVCERLYFKQPGQKLTLTAKTDRQQYGRRRKVTLHLQASVNDDPQVKPDLSVAVNRLDAVSQPDPQTIFNYLWLSSDLKGSIQSPEFYFSQDSTVSETADNLMLTHGWRRFNWEDILTPGKKHHTIPEYRGHLIKGKMTAAENVTVEGKLAYLSVPSKTSRIYAGRTDPRGEVLFEVPELYGQHKIIFQTDPLYAASLKLEIESPFSNQFGSTVVRPFELSPSIEKNFLQRAVAMQVQDIYHDESAIQTNQLPPDTTAFYGKADEIYYLDRYTRFPVMEEVMREYVPGVFVRKRKDGFHFIVTDIVNGGVFNETPMILLDGVPLFDADKILEVDPLKVKKLEVVSRRYYLGPLSMPGIVSYTTYEGDVAGIEMEPGSVSLDYDGLQLQREFYNPVYKTRKQMDSRIPDRRYLLYWNPEVTTNSDGSCDLEFYTSDIAGTFQVVIEGITPDGHAGSVSQTFLVE